MISRHIPGHTHTQTLPICCCCNHHHRLAGFERCFAPLHHLTLLSSSRKIVFAFPRWGKVSRWGRITESEGKRGVRGRISWPLPAQGMCEGCLEAPPSDDAIKRHSLVCPSTPRRAHASPLTPPFFFLRDRALSLARHHRARLLGRLASCLQVVCLDEWHWLLNRLTEVLVRIARHHDKQSAAFVGTKGCVPAIRCAGSSTTDIVLLLKRRHHCSGQATVRSASAEPR